MSYTNSSLASARRCLTEYDFRYRQLLESDGADAEVLQVGTCWHKAHEASAKGRDPFAAIAKHAPSLLWAEKLRRLFAAYAWWYENQALTVEKAEHTFSIEHEGINFRGQIDGIIRLPDGRRGVHELKTTSFDVTDGSEYWDKLRMDTQVGLYAVAAGFEPSFILYDVVRKPTINPKKLTNADIARIGKELKKNGSFKYFDESFSIDQWDEVGDDYRETPVLYGARLTSDIGARPRHYFARVTVQRTSQDYKALMQSLVAQVRLIEIAEREDLMFRNPDQCNAFGRCTFFGLCSNNIRPRLGDPAPAGFHFREHRHPELAQQKED